MDSNSHYEGTNESFPVENGYEIYPRALNIVWGKDGRYWKLPQETTDPAVLVQVSWLEVTGWCDQVEPDKMYDVWFKVKLTPDAFGWNDLPIYFMARSGKRSIWKKLNLTTKDITAEEDGTYLIPKNLCIKTLKAEENKLYFGMYEVWSGKWKGGLTIHKVIIKKSKKD